MNTRLVYLALATTTLVACAEATGPTSDAPLDPEHGLETLDGKDDSFAIRPGSPEAQAVVDYANRDIANDAEGDVFRDNLDAELHAWAARNITEFRAGADGTFGTADDRKFETVTEVDAVPWVGRSALMELFGLAEAAGLFQRPTPDCADYVDHDRWNNYRITSYADLLEVENSRCSVINGNLELRITGTDLLPPQARDIRNLRYLETINGDLRIITSEQWTSVHFEALETVTGDLRAESPEGREHTLDFPSLTSAKSIYMSEIGSSLFSALEHNANIQLHNTDLDGFTALKTADELRIYQQGNGTFDVAFPELTEVTSLRFVVHRPSSWRAPDVSFVGSFSKLAEAGSLAISNGKYEELTFPKLTEVGDLNTKQAFDAFTGMTALKNVDSLTSYEDQMTTGAHAGPVKLQTIGSMTITTELPVDGYDALELASGWIRITGNKGVQGFNALETSGGINLNIGRSREQIELNGFNALTYADAISISTSNAPTTVGTLFEKLEFTGGNLVIASNAGFDANAVFPSLAGVEGSFRVDVLFDGLDMMPELQLVDGTVTINRTPEELNGFPKLERIEGGLILKRSVSDITGLGKLTAIGGDLSVPRTLQQPELDNFLLQLEEFSGSINYN